MSKLKVLIAGGGTGGHLFPGMAVAEALEKIRPTEVRFVGTARGIEAKAVPERGWMLYQLPVSGLYHVGLVKKVFGLAKIPIAFLKSIKILLQFRPDLVIGVGGYASGPLLLAALFLRCHTVIQEQNAYPGMTNRLLGRLVPLSFVPFEGLEQVFKNPKVVGNPIRAQIQAVAALVDNRAAEPFTVVLIGGSQGARVLNQTMVAALPLLEGQGLKVYHQTGVADFEMVQQGYGLHPGITAEVVPFVDDVATWFHQAHLMLSRAGSMVHEVCTVGRASILVPIPNTSGDHQGSNARTLERAGAAVVILQSELNPEALAQQILNIKNNPTQLSQMERAAKSLAAKDTAKNIAEEALRFYHLEEKP